VDRRADVVPEARERQLGGPNTSPDRLLSLDDEDRSTGLRQRDRGREAVWPRADDDRV
jgi:hypothetical protein